MDGLPAPRPLRTAKQLELLRHFDACMARVFLERSGTGQCPWASDAGSTLFLDEATDKERDACPVRMEFEPANRDIEFLQLSGNPHGIKAVLEEVPAFRELSGSSLVDGHRHDSKQKKFCATVSLHSISKSLNKPPDEWTEADKMFLSDVTRSRAHNPHSVACEFKPQVPGGGTKLQAGAWGHGAASPWLLRIEKARPLNGFSTFPPGVTCTCKVGDLPCCPATETLLFPVSHKTCAKFT